MSTVGDIARTAAAAPRAARIPAAPEPEAAAPIAVTGPKEFIDADDSANQSSTRENGIARGSIVSVFTGIVFRVAENDTIYENNKNGVKSKKLATVMVELNHSGIYLKGSIYARQGKHDQKARAEFSFFGSQNQTCLSVDDPASKTELDKWRANVAREYVAWLKTQPVTSGGRISLGVDLDGITL